MYFNNFKQVWYDLEENKKFQLATNILQRVAFRKRLKDEGDFYIEYSAKDTDKPEIIADKIYGDSNFHWVVLLFNEYLNPLNQWVRSQQGMADLFEREYKGNVLFVDTSDFVYKVGDFVTVDRCQENADGNCEWRTVGEYKVLETDKSLHKIVLSGDVDYQVGDYVTVDRISEIPDDFDDIPETKAAYVPPNFNDAIVIGDKPGTISIYPDGYDDDTNPEINPLGICYNLYQLTITMTGNKNADGQLCGYRVFADLVNAAVCEEDDGTEDQSHVSTENMVVDSDSCTFSFKLSIHVYGGACYCIGTTNFAPSGRSLEKVKFDPCLDGGCEPGGYAEQIFNQFVEDNRVVGGLASCCGDTPSLGQNRSMRVLPQGVQPEPNEKLWFGIPKEKIVDSMLKEYRGYNSRVNLSSTEVMQPWGKRAESKKYPASVGNAGDSPYQQKILKIVDLPEKSLHHFENSDGDTINPFSDLQGNTFTGSTINPQPVPFEDTLLYLHTQENQILDSESIKVISIEEHELDVNEKKRNIKLLKPEFLDIAVKELEDLLGGE